MDVHLVGDLHLRRELRFMCSKKALLSTAPRGQTLFVENENRIKISQISSIENIRLFQVFYQGVEEWQM